MDIDYPADAEAFRAEVRAVLAEELPPGFGGLGAIADPQEADAFVDRWREVLARRRLLGVSWPVECGGRGLTKAHQVVLVEELAAAGVPAGGHNDNFSIKMIGGTLLRWGTEEQRRTLLPRVLSGEDVWCQGYSEPGAGSDLAGLTTRAVADGDHWVINGQKIWTSNAHRANRIFVLARTDPAAERHRGISFLLVDLEQPGVTVRPIRMASGESEFNEVFFDDARAPLGDVVGPVGAGWKVAMTLLGFERGDEAATNPVLFRAEFDRLVELVRTHGLQDDAHIRQKLGRLYAEVEVMRHLGYRILTTYLAGEAPAAESSVTKLYWSEYHQRATDFALEVAGLSGQVLTGRLPLRAYRTDDPGAPPVSGTWVGSYLNARAGTIYAGSSEIQRTILAESVLGMPRARAAG